MKRLIAVLVCMCVVTGTMAGGKYESWKELETDLIEKTILRQWIPMRDGVRLDAEIYLPNTAEPPYPTVLIRSPYPSEKTLRPFDTYTAFVRAGYAIVFQNELWLVGLHIAAYSHSAGAFGHEMDRRRKLLAHRAEIDRWAARVEREKLAIIPLSLYFKDGRAKLEIALARGRSQADRRQDIARRDADREAQRAMSRNRSGKY